MKIFEIRGNFAVISCCFLGAATLVFSSNIQIVLEHFFTASLGTWQHL